MPSMHAEHIRVGYGDKPIIQDLTVAIPAGKVTTIIGPNGCGKSTFLKTCTRLLAASSGSVYLDGAAVSKIPTKELARKMAILPQTQNSAAGLTVYELVSYGRFPYQRGFGRLSREDRRMIDEAMEMTGTSAFADKPVDGLSGGQRQRVWIAMALAQNTELIFLDEPTTYLDMAHQLEVLELLQRLNRLENRTIVMVLHDLNQAARFSDYLIAMKDGDVRSHGSAQEIMQPHVLRDVFSIEAVIGKDPVTGTPMCMSYQLACPQDQHILHSSANG
ncbi:ABC transporter ATP-binding protein [Bacillus daqingensis]|uniref:ABC transporter ATP-binding protein n=1 Tax=Bacillus daqingensis TaxID=872396 RepID=A0ABV9NU65_9BACI